MDWCWIKNDTPLGPFPPLPPLGSVPDLQMEEVDARLQTIADGVNSRLSGGGGRGGCDYPLLRSRSLVKRQTPLCPLRYAQLELSVSGFVPPGMVTILHHYNHTSPPQLILFSVQGKKSNVKSIQRIMIF